MSTPTRETSTRTELEWAIVFATRVWFVLSTIGIQGVLAWILGPEGRGAYAVCFTFGIMFGLFFTISVDRAGQHFVMSKEMSVSQGVAAVTIITIVGSVIAIAVGWLLIHTPISFFQKATVSDFELSLWLIPTFILNSAFEFQLNGLRRFVSRAVITVIQTTTNLVLVVLFLAVFDLGVKGALAAHVISLLLAIILQILDLRVHCDYRFVLPQWRHCGSILHYGARYFVARIGNTVDVQLGVLLLGFIATQEEIGLFSAASALSLRTLIFAQSIEISMLPRIASAPDQRDEIVRRCLRLSSLLTGVTLILLVLVSVPLVGLLLSPSFLPAVPLIWILAPGILFRGWGGILVGCYRVINRPGFTSWSTWVGLMVNALLFVALYPKIGVFAAAWSMSLGFIIRTLVLVTPILRTSPRDLSRMFWPQRQDIALARTSLRQAYVRLMVVLGVRQERS